jgi:hypothetical protein
MSTFVNRVSVWCCLWEWNIDGFSESNPLIKFIRHFDWASGYTIAAPIALLFVNISGLLQNLDLEVPSTSLDFFNLTISEKLNVWMALGTSRSRF